MKHDYNSECFSSALVVDLIHHDAKKVLLVEQGDRFAHLFRRGGSGARHEDRCGGQQSYQTRVGGLEHRRRVEQNKVVIVVEF